MVKNRMTRRFDKKKGASVDTLALRTSLRKFVGEKFFSEVPHSRVEVIGVQRARGWPYFAWNAIFYHALLDGCEYFVQTFSDSYWNTPGWLLTATDYLVNSPKKLGVVEVPSPESTSGFISQETHFIFHANHLTTVHLFAPDSWKSPYTNFFDDLYGDLLEKLPHNDQTSGSRQLLQSDGVNEAAVTATRTLQTWKSFDRAWQCKKNPGDMYEEDRSAMRALLVAFLESP